MYRVIKYFTDLQDKDHPYNVGDIFPREGVNVTEERLAELSGSHNKQGMPLIERVEETIEELEKEEVPKEKKTRRRTTASK